MPLNIVFLKPQTRSRLTKTLLLKHDYRSLGLKSLCALYSLPS